MINQRHARLTIIADAGPIDRKRQVLCRCDCGTEKVIRLDLMQSGRVKSCGCQEHVRTKMEYGFGAFALQDVWRRS